MSRFALIDGSHTPLAVASVDADGEPTYVVYGQPLPTVVAAVGDDVADAVVESAALFVSSNTLVGVQERSVTMRAVEAARATARPLVVDPNIRVHRWGSPTRRRGRRERVRAGGAAGPRQRRGGGADDRRGRSGPRGGGPG